MFRCAPARSFTLCNAPANVRVHSFSSARVTDANDLHGRVVVVSGGSRGIGKAIAEQFAIRGASVAYRIHRYIELMLAAVLSRDMAALRKSMESLPRVGNAEHTCFAADVSRADDISSASASILAQYAGRIDTLINCAGIIRDKLFISASDEDIQSVLEVNLMGTMLLTRAFLPSLVKQKQGCIINIGSVVGQTGNVGQAVYSASKAGLTGFTKSLAKEVGSRGIRVNMIVPGFIDTAMTQDLSEAQKKAVIERIPLRRFGTVQEIAHAALFVDSASYLTGQSLVIDGGLL